MTGAVQHREVGIGDELPGSPPGRWYDRGAWVGPLGREIGWPVEEDAAPPRIGPRGNFPTGLATIPSVGCGIAPGARDEALAFAQERVARAARVAPEYNIPLA